MNTLQNVPSAKGIKFTVALAARIAFLVRSFPLPPLTCIDIIPSDIATLCPRPRGLIIGD